MTVFDEVKGKLEKHPDFRERRFRADKLAILALRSLGLETKYYVLKQPLTVDEMISFAKKFDTYRHEWDAVMRAHPELHGSDYEDKKQIVQEKLIEFGYESGYHGNVRKLGTVNA